MNFLKKWWRLPVCILIALALAIPVIVGLNRATTGQSKAFSVCILQESKPVLLIALDGKGADAMCKKITVASHERYFTFYGSVPSQYQVMCFATIKHIQFTVYDIVPSGVSPAMRYSMQTVCPLLVNTHRLIGEGF